MKKELQGFEEDPRANMQLRLLRATLKKTTKLEKPVYDGIKDSDFQKIMGIPDSMSHQLNKCLEEENIPESMTKEKTNLIQKDRQKGTISSNYRPIKCLRLMWKIAARRKSITRLYAEYYFTKNRKDAAREPKKQMIYCTLISTPSERIKLDEKYSHGIDPLQKNLAMVLIQKRTKMWS